MAKPYFVICCLLPSVLAAQAEPDPRRTALDEEAATLLCNFARQAERQKWPSRAQQVYRMVLEHYDEENVAAHKGLGRRLVDGAWIEGESAGSDTDEASERTRARLEKAWERVRSRVAEMHRELAQQLDEEGQVARSLEQFERAVALDPEDRRSHEALGHRQLDGFWAPAEWIECAERMRAIRAFADELRERTYEVREVPQDQLPAELKRSGLTFHGARSEHFVHWNVESQEEAERGLQWAERAWDLLGFLLGDSAHERRAEALRYHARLQRKEQQKQLLEASEACRGEYTLSQALMFGGSAFNAPGGRGSYAIMHRRTRDDEVVGHVVKRHMSVENPALSEGLVHACTWLLCGTTATSYASLPRTVAGNHEVLGNDPEQWRRRLWGLMDTRKDWPLEQLPRERYDNMRQEARIKAWSFVAFLLGRYPDRWLQIMYELGSDKGLTVELVQERMEAATGRTLSSLDEEWREWARRDSPWGKVSRF